MQICSKDCALRWAPMYYVIENHNLETSVNHRTASGKTITSTITTNFRRPTTLTIAQGIATLQEYLSLWIALQEYLKMGLLHICMYACCDKHV